MESMLQNILYTLLRATLSMFVLFLLSRMLGPRQISQMSLYDYILGITIGSIAATMAIDDSIPIYVSIAAMAVYAVFTLLMSLLTNKSIKARKFFSQTPKVLIENGKILEKSLRKTHIDINDLTSAARVQGIFDLGSVLFAVIEPTGSISFLQRKESMPITPESKESTEENTVFANVVIDGNVMPNALKAIGRNGKWLDGELRRAGTRADKVLLATADMDGNIRIYEKYTASRGKDYFI